MVSRSSNWIVWRPNQISLRSVQGNGLCKMSCLLSLCLCTSQGLRKWYKIKDENLLSSGIPLFYISVSAFFLKVILLFFLSPPVMLIISLQPAMSVAAQSKTLTVLVKVIYIYKQAYYRTYIIWPNVQSLQWRHPFTQALRSLVRTKVCQAKLLLQSSCTFLLATKLNILLVFMIIFICACAFRTKPMEKLEISLVIS